MAFIKHYLPIMYADRLPRNCFRCRYFSKWLLCYCTQPSAVLSTTLCHFELSSHCNKLVRYALPEIADVLKKKYTPEQTATTN